MGIREIIFRGKRSDNGEWVYGFYSALPDCAGTVYMIETPKANPDETNRTYFVDPSTVGQFTGLTDKNGKKIFEGDIVLKRTYHGKEPRRVVFSFGCFHCGFGGGSSTATHPYTLDDKQIEVIGTIHDNPELLGEVSE